MKFSCEARVEASMNRQDIIVDKVSRAIEVIEAYIDSAVERGYFHFTNNMSEFLEDFGTEIKEEITDYLSMYGYNVSWTACTITVSFQEG